MLPHTWSRRTVLAAALGLTVLLGVLDYLTGLEISFALVYLLPVSLAAWFAGEREGTTVAVAATITWLTAAGLAGESFPNAGVALWNVVTRLGPFLIVGILLTRLRDALEREKEASRVDFLTGALNGRAFHAAIASEGQRLLRHGRPFTLSYIDLDNFKTVNDRYGHSVGDAALQTAARVMQQNLRGSDLVARLGGDEFGILLPETDCQSAEVVIGKIHARLLEAMCEQRWPVTFSVGVVTFNGSAPPVDEMLRCADALMYSVKAGEKNAVRYETYSGLRPRELPEATTAAAQTGERTPATGIGAVAAIDTPGEALRAALPLSAGNRDWVDESGRSPERRRARL